MFLLQSASQSAAWLSAQEPPLQKVRQQKSGVKTILIAFFDWKGFANYEYVQFGQTVNAPSFIWVMKRFMTRTCRVRPEYRNPEIRCLLHGNTMLHTAHNIQQYFTKNQITVLYHLPYSPYLSSADCFLFLKVKLEMKRAFFQDVKAISAKLTRHLKAIPIKEYLHSFQSLYRRAQDYIMCEMDCVEPCYNFFE